jgi:predicted RNase H-like HicB family nuclease
MDKITFIIEQAEEGGFNAKAINQSIFTQAETLELLEVNITDAIACHFDDIRPSFELKFADK